MSPDTKTPQPADASNHLPRRKYAAPRLRSLGSVRDLTLGSPPGPRGDGIRARMAG